MLQAMLAEAKNPKELAQKLQMTDPRQQNAILQELSRSNPRLFNHVLRAMQALNSQGPGGGARGTVDMRPLPEQKPPNRTEKPV